MAVTTATYTATATWTASQLADIFRSAFIDAGLMTEWHDSFLNTIENRVLEVQYDNAKTYGKTYYWFQFTTGGVFFNLATGWTAGSDIPSGTQYLDYYSTTTSATSNHRQLLTLSASTTTTLTRFTSGDYSWFVLKNGTTSFTFHVVPASASRNSWIDLDKVFFNGFNYVSLSTNARMGLLDFVQPYGLRRMLGVGSALTGVTAASSYANVLFPVVQRYMMAGSVSNSLNNNYPSSFAVLPGVLLPYNTSANNGAYSTDYTPVFSAPAYNHWLSSSLPADFGIAATYADNTLAVLDTYTVSAGTEVWTVLAVSNNAATTTGATPMLLARTT